MDFRIVLTLTGFVLFLLIVALLLRIVDIGNALKGKSSSNVVSGANKINAYLFPIYFILLFGLFFWYSPIAAKNYLPESASVHGVETDKMFWLVIYIISAVVFVTHVLLFLFPFLYQYKEGRKANYFPENNTLEIGWTVAPAIVLAGLIAYGWSTWTTITGPVPEKAVELEIMGFQFAWKVRYPGADGKFGKYYFRNIEAGNDLGLNLDDQSNFDDFIPTEIHIPVNQPVKFNIRARDVIHSVFLPHFRQKMDAVPGMPTSLWFIPKYTTAQMRGITKNDKFNYELACTEVCGKGHYSMRYIVIVDTPEDYKKWYESQKSWLVDNEDIVKKIKPELRNSIPGFKGLASEEVAKVEAVANTTSHEDTTVLEEKDSDGNLEEVQSKAVQFAKGVYFKAAGANLKDESFAVLDEFASLLTANPSIDVEIQGHTDKLSISEKMNINLSQKRADEVKNYLLGKGINAARLQSKGFGSSVPVDNSGSESGRAKNRRVEFKLSSSKSKVVSLR